MLWLYHHQQTLLPYQLRMHEASFLHTHSFRKGNAMRAIVGYGS